LTIDTFYIQAHYAIDAIAGLFVGTFMYFLLKAVYWQKK
jgi:membrane-associated phospholipid phosphatase